MRTKLILLLGIVLLSSSLKSEVDLDYNYEYEKNGTHTKFSDWIPYKLHKWEPKFLEDFYELYGLKLHYGENELRRDIYFLKIGLKKRFRNPKNALCEIKDENAYYKYRLLVFMHINLQIMRSLMRIGSLYDKRHLYFYNLDYAYDLKKSFEIANSFYKESKDYWKKAKDYADKADKVPIDLDLGTIESERFDISHGKLDFEKIIDTHLSKLDKKQKIVDEFLTNNPAANSPRL
ncbi:MAG: hypothetical protein L6Q54_13415 [Leptospiraceae bacterium]|nr:hypothetical protein [Leptospiraceae bacterium]MCK6382233.1 hypothetical protein [Leptospiraceae bacterium]NUM40595.1 hypothetical protein [Leptospiraceae bacterium]